MKTLVPRVANSLFFRLLLIFSATVIFFFVIISLSLRQLDQNWRAERVSPIPDFYLNNINQIVDSIGIPPDLRQASQLAQDLSLTIIIRSPHINWQSDEADDLDIEQAQFVRSLSDEAQMMTVGDEDVIRVARGGYEYFLNRKVPSLSDYDYFVIYMGLGVAIIVLFLNYWLVRRLLEPVRLLREGAERICEGDLGYRVQTKRTDELGELTTSINQRLIRCSQCWKQNGNCCWQSVMSCAHRLRGRNCSWSLWMMARSRTICVMILMRLIC